MSVRYAQSRPKPLLHETIPPNQYGAPRFTALTLVEVKLPYKRNPRSDLLSIHFVVISEKSYQVSLLHFDTIPEEAP